MRVERQDRSFRVRDSADLIYARGSEHLPSARSRREVIAGPSRMLQSPSSSWRTPSRSRDDLPREHRPAEHPDYSPKHAFGSTRGPHRVPDTPNASHARPNTAMPSADTTRTALGAKEWTTMARSTAATPLGCSSRAALVLFMTPGLALFYAGMVRSKNVLSTTMQSLLRDGPRRRSSGRSSATRSRSGRRGAARQVHRRASSYLGPERRAATAHSARAPPIPQSVFAMYQGMFAIITRRAHHRRVRRADEVQGVRAASRRCGRSSSTPRSPTGSGAAAGSCKLGALDFAGGTVVHIASAAAALACAHRARQAHGPRHGPSCSRTTCR